MNESAKKNTAGFSLLELIISMTITLILMGMAGTIFSHSIGTREREMRRTAAITAAQSTLNLISREIANSGYGLTDNGIVTDDSNDKRVHFRSNIQNSNATTSDLGEDLTYYYDAASNSIVRYDASLDPANTSKTSTVADRVKDLTFKYWDYNGYAAVPVDSTTPSANTARVTITVTLELEPVQGQPSNQLITYTSDVTLRNSKYISGQY